MNGFDKATVTLMAVGLTVVCSAGCMTTGGSGQVTEEAVFTEPLETEPMLTPPASLRFDDVPVPSTFVLDRKSSFAFENDQTRVAYLVYEGKAELQEVVQFLLNQLPGDGWRLGNVVEHQDTTLVFSEKSRGEQLVVTVAESGRNVMLSITLTPAGPNRMSGPSR